MSDMADVLAEHLPVYKFSHELRTKAWACSTPRCEVEGEFSAVIAHQAAALSGAGFGLLADAKAEAWDEGFDYSRRESWTEEANPYRAHPVTPSEAGGRA